MGQIVHCSGICCYASERSSYENNDKLSHDATTVFLGAQRMNHMRSFRFRGRRRF